MKTKLILGFSFILFFLVVSCNDSPTINEFDDTFAIYISKEQLRQEISSIDKIELSKEPLIKSKDIAEYHWSKHQIIFSDEFHEKLKARGNLLHKVFIIIAEGQRVYWGKFMDDLDSGTCQNPVIRLMLRHPDGRNTTPNIFVIERAYPEYLGSAEDEDIRNNSKIYQALLNSGVLRN